MLDRSRQDLFAARLLAEAGFANQAVSRAYYAAFYAAEDALGELGESRTKHSGVISAFGKLLVKDGPVEPDVGRLLPRLFDLRNSADHLDERIDPARAEQAIDEAERFVEAVAAWHAGRPRSAT